MSPLFSSTNKKKYYCAIEFGRQCVRLLVLEKTSFGYIPSVHDEVALAHDVSTGAINWDELREALALLTEKHPLREAHIIIPETDAYIIEAPAKDMRDVQETLYDSTSFAPADLEYDAVFEGDSVTIIAIHKKLLQCYREILAQCAITPLSIQTESQAVARLATDSLNYHHSVVSIHVGAYKTVITLSKKGLPYKTKTISHNRITSFEEKNLLAVAWRKNIARTLFHVYEKEGMLQQHSKKEVYVSGDLSRATLEDAQSFLRNAVGNAHIESFPVWKHCFSIEEYIPSIYYEDALRYTNVLGGALSDVLLKDKH